MFELDQSLPTYGIGRKAKVAITDNPPEGISFGGRFGRQDATSAQDCVLSGLGEPIDGVINGNYAAGQHVNMRKDGNAHVTLGGSVTRTATLDDGYLGAGALGKGIAWDGVSACGGQIIYPGSYVTGDVVAIDMNKKPAGAASSAAADGFGGSSTIVVDEEEITLSTSGTTTLSVANLLRANAILVGFTYRWTVAMLTGTDWIAGKDGGDTDGFVATNTTFTLGATGVGAGALIGTLNVAAGKVIITTTGTPTAGKIRVVLVQRVFTPPTS